MKTIFGSSQVKYFSARQSLMFLSTSLFLLWGWMFLCVKIDRNNDREFLTLIGMAALLAAVLSVFFSKDVLINFIITFFRLLVSIVLITFLSFTLGLYVERVANSNWAGFSVLLVSTSILIYSTFVDYFLFRIML